VLVVSEQIIKLYDQLRISVFLDPICEAEKEVQLNEEFIIEYAEDYRTWSDKVIVSLAKEGDVRFYRSTKNGKGTKITSLYYPMDEKVSVN
jgi:hypothetical protein